MMGLLKPTLALRQGTLKHTLLMKQSLGGVDNKQLDDVNGKRSF